MTANRRDPGLRHGIDVVMFVTLFLVLLFAIPANYVVRQGFGGLGAPAVLVAFGAAAWWLLGTLYPKSGLHRGTQPMRVALFALLASVLVTFGLAYRGALVPADARAADRGLLFMAAMAGLALLIADGVDTLDRLVTLFRRLVLAASLIALVGIVEYEMKHNFVSTVYNQVPFLSLSKLVNFAGISTQFTSIRRVSGTAIHPIEFGVVLAMALPFAAHFALMDDERSGLRRWWKVVVILIAELTAQSRSGLLVILIAALVLMPAWPRAVRRQIYILSVPCLIAARLAFPGLLGTIRNLFLNVGEDSSTQSRIARYPMIFHFISQRPLFGRGFQTFDAHVFFPVDNQYLMSLIETGIVGTLVFAALLVTGITLAAKSARWAANDEERLLARTLTASIAGVSVAFATFDFFSFTMATGTFFLLLGSSGALWRIMRARARERSPATTVRAVELRSISR